MDIKVFFRKVLPPSLYEKIKISSFDFFHRLARQSLNEALREQRLFSLNRELADIVPDIRDQYSTFRLNTPYLIEKVRGQHAFQISLVNEAVERIDKKENLKIVDIGDSAGTHIKYIQEIFKRKSIQCVSINFDEDAVDKIKRQGLKALCVRAEELVKKYSIDADVFLSFEMLEHLLSPIDFLKNLSANTSCELFVVTVPFLRKSRVGLHSIRNGNSAILNAERTHIFELSPQDWKLIFKFTGWHVVFEKIYLQYPKKHWLMITKPYWENFDFEGFYGLILRKDNSYSSKYADW